MMITEPQVIFDEGTRQTIVAVPIAFTGINFAYYDEDQCYLQFDSIWLPPDEKISAAILAAADMQFSHIFRCVELTSDDGQGYNQISIRPLHGDNLLERLRMAELEVSIKS